MAVKIKNGWHYRVTKGIILPGVTRRGGRQAAGRHASPPRRSSIGERQDIVSRCPPSRHINPDGDACKVAGIRAQSIYASCGYIYASCEHIYETCECIYASFVHTLHTAQSEFTSHPVAVCIRPHGVCIRPCMTRHADVPAADGTKNQGRAVARPCDYHVMSVVTGRGSA